MPPAKRKRVTKAFKSATTLNIDVSVNSILDDDGKVTFHVNSQFDKSKIYQIEYKSYGSSLKPRLVCNCGHQFGRDDRDHCKHIAAVILYQMVQLSFSTNSITSTSSSPPLSAFDETTLINMFKDLGAKVGGSTDFFQPATFKYKKVSQKKNPPVAVAAPAPPVAAPSHPAFNSSVNPFTIGTGSDPSPIVSKSLRKLPWRSSHKLKKYSK